MLRPTRRLAFALAAVATGALVTLGLVFGWPGTDGGPGHPPPTHELPHGAVAAAGAARDPATGLPTRVVHETSGVHLVLIPAGELLMGEPGGPTRRRVIREPFYLGETEVTVAQFRRFADQAGYRSDAERGVREGDHTVGAFSELIKGQGHYREWHRGASWRNPLPNFAELLGEQRLSGDWPVVQVSWHDAKRFAAHFGLALPSEAQWEHACRAGSGARFPWGEAAAGAGHANVADASFDRHQGRREAIFPFDDGVITIAKVAQYRRNAWGLYDMIGNVEEWCEDEFRSRVPDELADESAVVARGGGEHHHVIRGGSWFSGPGGCSSGQRHVILAEGRREWIGFRVAAPLRRVEAEGR